MMTERDFRLAIWGAVMQFVRALGKYWGLADDIKIIRYPVKTIPENMRPGESMAGAPIYKD